MTYAEKLKCLLESIGKSRHHNSSIEVKEIKRDIKGAHYKITNNNPMNYPKIPKPCTYENYFEDCFIDELYNELLQDKARGGKMYKGYYTALVTSILSLVVSIIVLIIK